MNIPLVPAPIIPCVTYFLSERRPAVSYLEPFYYFGSERGQKELVDGLEKNRPALVVLGGPVASVGGQTLTRDAPMVDRYIRLHYRPHGVVGRYQIWKRIE